jgi:hypothetical protein
MSNQEIFDIVLRENEGKIGIICINCIIVRTRFKELEEFVSKNNIKIPTDKQLSKLEYLDFITIHFYKKLKNDPKLHEKYPNCLSLIAEELLNDVNISKYLSRFDFIATHELIEVFADYCADMGISVYDTSYLEDDEYQTDLYLIKKKPFLRTEAVFVRTGSQMTKEKYKDTFYLLNEASKIAAWTVFVTTPKGAYNIGLERLISDMEKLNIWLYVVDPIHQRVLGITKGKKSKDHETELRDNYIKKIPKEPIRAQSRLGKISDYDFSESESYNPKRFSLYELLNKEAALEMEISLARKPRYKRIFRNLLVIDISSGLPLITHSREDLEVDKELISGFLSAMDSFISELSGAGSMSEIHYKDFYITGETGNSVKVALILTNPASKSLRERLVYFLKDFEDRYSEEIETFSQTGNVKIFDKEVIIPDINDILDV